MKPIWPGTVLADNYGPISTGDGMVVGGDDAAKGGNAAGSRPGRGEPWMRTSSEAIATDDNLLDIMTT